MPVFTRTHTSPSLPLVGHPTMLPNPSNEKWARGSQLRPFPPFSLLSLAAVLIISLGLTACGGGSAASGGTTSSSGGGTTGGSSGGQTVTTQWATISEPQLPQTLCATLAADLIPAQNGSIDALDANPSMSQPDTARIQAAINACPAGQAVKLVAGPVGQPGFLTGPLTLSSGVTLWIDAGVTLYASRNPADYDNGVGTCGTATSANVTSCNALITASNTVQSAIVGGGAIDGRGGSLLTNGPNAGRRSWWDVAYQSKSALYQQNPRLIVAAGGSAFTLYNITLMNAPMFHVVTSAVSGVTAWGIKILTPSLEYTVSRYACPNGTTPNVVTPATCFTPDTTLNTDGFDPGDSNQVLLAYSYISDGDDNVAVTSHHTPAAYQLAFLHNHFYYGHGLSIGSETDGGVSNMIVQDLVVDGNDSPNGNGLRIKSDSSRGGKVDSVSYSQVCMQNVRHPLIFDPFYSTLTGNLYPSFTNITISDFHDLGSVAYAGQNQLLTFTGYEVGGQDNPLVITLNNVVFDGVQPGFAAAHNGGPASPAATHFTLGPGSVSFASSLVPSMVTDVTVTGNTSGTSAPVACSSSFVPLSSILSNSPI